MELYLDTADLAQVTRLARILPIAGVTTNPSIIAKEKRPVFETLAALRDILGKEKRLFAQTMAHDAEGMIREATELCDRIDNLVVKVPTTAEGLIAIKALKAQGIATLGTAVYGAGQGFLAALAGAKYVAPYVNRIDSQGGDGVATVRELQTLLSLHKPDSIVLAASFRTPRQVLDCMLAGIKAITVGCEVLELFIRDPAVFAAVEQFDKDWQSAFGKTGL